VTTPPIVTLAGVLPAVMAAVVAAIDLDGYEELGVPARLWTYDQIPQEPAEPYGCAAYVDPGHGWDAGLVVAGTSGFIGMALTGVGRMEQSATWVLDVARSYLARLDLTTVGVGNTHVKSITSQGPPVGPIEAGTLCNMVETYELFVEAS
jgi:hypothetical protein